jgi:hypothetical protein
MVVAGLGRPRFIAILPYTHKRSGPIFRYIIYDSGH